MAFAGLEALVHAATEERKRLSAGTLSDHSPAAAEHPSPARHPPLRSPEDSYRLTQSPSLVHQREFPAVLPPSHASRHRPLPPDDPRPPDDYHPPRPSASASPYPRLTRQQYEEEQRQHLLLAQQERERELQLIEQRRLEEQIEQKRLEHQRLERQRMFEQWEHRQREETALRQKQQEQMDRERLLEQQRLEKLRLQGEQLLIERRMQEAEQLERRRQEQEYRRREEKRRIEEQILAEREEQHREEERQRDAQRRREEESLLKEQRCREEERQLEEQRRQEEEERQIEEQRLREERQIEEQRRWEEERRIVEQRRREEEYRMEQQRILQRQRLEEEERQQRQADREAQEPQDPQRLQPQEIRLGIRYATQLDQRRSPPQDTYQQPPTHSATPATIELPQPLRPYPHPTGPRKSDPIQIKRQASPDSPSLQIPLPAPLSSPIDDHHRPLKKQRYSESPPLSSIEPVHPRVVVLPPPISTDQLAHRSALSAVRRPGSGQGRRLPLGSLGDAVEREREKERERERHLPDVHRIISPLGRRSPPGSQIGRAKAAKKTDDARRGDEAPTATAGDVRKTEEVQPQLRKADEGLPSFHTEARRPSQEQLPSPSRNRDTPAPNLDEPAVRKPDDAARKMSLDVVMNDGLGTTTAVKKESLQSVAPQSPPRPIRKEATVRSKSIRSRSSDTNQPVVDAPREVDTQEISAPRPAQQEDAHEWLLVHYAQSPSASQQPPEPPRSPSPSTSPVLAVSQRPEQVKVRTSSPEVARILSAPRSVSPDADAALERELAELMAEEEEEVSAHKHEPDDMDIDLAVAQTLDEDIEKPDVVAMEVDEADDVEDELLSLVDDRPPPPPVLLPPPPPLAARNVVTPTIVAHQSQSLFKPAPLKMNTEDSSLRSPPSLPTSVPSPSAVSPAVRPSPARPGSDRSSMPPPSATASRGKEKGEDASKKADSGSTASIQTAKKRKEVGSKVTAKGKTGNAILQNAHSAVSSNKQQKAKATATKKKGVDAVTNNATHTSATPNAGTAKSAKSSTMTSKKLATANNVAVSRSRSTSVMPTGSADPEPERKSEEKNEEEEDSAEAVDDKLYCVCKTKYDEDRFMIACDRCDEWYHTTCVDMPDLEVDLVDQFFCPLCIDQNPHLRLKTTYKRRCLNGLRHPDPDSPKACHKPARGAFSKYCSEECGVKYMQSRIDAWAKKGGKKEELFESVKNAERREGVSVCVDEKIKSELEKTKKKQGKVDREAERLQALLSQVVKMREEIKSNMQVLVWRERLLQLASERAEHIDQCGWDQRLCFGDEEWQDFGAGVLESYDEVKAEKEESGMQVEGDEEGEWWCPGPKSCKRHTGWQTLRYKDICKEKEKKEDLLTKVTTRERQLRKRIEDLMDPSGRKPNDSTSQVPLKSSNTKLSNGHAKTKGTTETLKKGKKRKAPAS